MIIKRPRRPVHLTYCSNLHAIEEPDSLQALAVDFWPRLADRLKIEHALTASAVDLGVWLSSKTCSALKADRRRVKAFSDQLKSCNTSVLTANAFPMGDFHAGSVKHDVYLPDWQEDARLQYSKDVARLLCEMPTQSETLSMSTSPGSFKAFEDVDRTVIAANLAALAQELDRLHQETGKLILLGVEPEPGCTFETTDEWISFFKDELVFAHAADEEIIRRHIGICFDTCHMAIQYESPAESLNKLMQAGIGVAKMQLSSALHIDHPAENPDALSALATFAEDRYLHQVVALSEDGTLDRFNDLPQFLFVAKDRNHQSARIHFHVPVFLEEVGPLGTTQNDLSAALKAALSNDQCDHFEIETYSWGVMPERRGTATSTDEMLEDIIREYAWVVPQIQDS